MLAVIMGNATMTSCLLSHGADIHTIDKCGRSVLHWFILTNIQLGASEEGKHKYSILEEILQHNMDIHRLDMFDRPAMSYLTFMNKTNQQVVRQSFQQLNIECKENAMYLHYTKTKEHIESYFHLPGLFKCDTDSKHDWYDSKAFLHDILYTTGIGIVDGVNDFESLARQVDVFIEALAKEMSQADSHKLSYRSHISGSRSEGTKVNLPDEFDYLLYVEGLESILIADYSNAEAGYVKLKAMDGVDISEFEFIDHQGFLDSIRFTPYFFSLVLGAMQKPHLWQNTILYWDYGDSNSSEHLDMQKANFYIELQSPLNDFGQIKLTIDLVPVFSLPEKW